MDEMTEVADWEPVGERNIRKRTETNRVITLAGDPLTVSGFEEGTEVSIFSRKNEIRLYEWEDGIPHEVVAPDHAGSRGIFLPCGVFEIHYSGDSLMVTVPERALARAGFTSEERLTRFAKPGAIKLVPEGEQS